MGEGKEEGKEKGIIKECQIYAESISTKRRRYQTQKNGPSQF